MKAARFVEYRIPPSLDVTDAPKPRSPRGAEVLIRSVGGVCHSDLHIIRGEWRGFSDNLVRPYTLGHELAGWIEEAGEAAEEAGFKKGDPVVGSGGWGCGACELCQKGHEQICALFRLNNVPGLSTNPEWQGTYAEYVLVPTYIGLVNLKGTGIEPEKAAPVSDAALTPYHAIKMAKKLIDLGPESFIVIRGIGGLGHFAVQLAKATTQSTVIAITSSEDKVDVIQKLGADHVILEGKGVNIKEEVKKITKERMADLVIEFWVTDERITEDFKLVKPYLGILMPVGLGYETTSIKYMTFSDGLAERHILGSYWGTAREVAEIIGLVKAGKVTLDYVKNYPLEKINDIILKLHEKRLWTEEKIFRATVK
ncbi:MAG TPA: hypothetical protein ENF80_02675 [Thermofilum sp.]|nr:hypothetical protein [Thermofilum sp.]